MNVTLLEIAKLARTSKSTVSRVLRGELHVDSKTRKRVRNAIKRTGYKPNLFARGLRGYRTGIIAALGQWMEGEFMMETLRGIHDEAARHHLHVLTRFTPKPADFVQAWRQFAQGGVVDGAVLIAPPREIFQHAVETGDVPMVLCASRSPENATGWTRVDSVVMDNAVAMADLLSHLVSQGCRRLVHLEGAADNYDTSERSRFFNEFTARNNQVNGEVIPAVERREQVGLKLKAYLEKTPELPDAFVSFNDDIAMGVVDELREQAISIPSA
ncbi:MAG: LacI family DNA-binding transcriptional regulator, partial [Lentisphaerota bacterium]